MNTTELAAQLRRLAALDSAQLDADERKALEDAAQRLERGQGVAYTITRLLAPFLARIRPGKGRQAVDVGDDERFTAADWGADLGPDGGTRVPMLTPEQWDTVWGGRIRQAQRNQDVQR